MEKCDTCPIKEKINLFNTASKTPELADRLWEEMRLGSASRVEKKEHFWRTAATIELRCKINWLCLKRV